MPEDQNRPTAHQLRVALGQLSKDEQKKLDQTERELEQKLKGFTAERERVLDGASIALSDMEEDSDNVREALEDIQNLRNRRTELRIGQRIEQAATDEDQPPEEPNGSDDPAEIPDELFEGLYTKDELTQMEDAWLDALAADYGLTFSVASDTDLDPSLRRTVLIEAVVQAQSKYCFDYAIKDPNSDKVVPAKVTTASVPTTSKLRPHQRAKAATTNRWNGTSDRIKVWLLTLVVAVVILVIMNIHHDTILGWAQGEEGWKDNSFVQMLVIWVPTLLGAYWAWIFFDEKFASVDEAGSKY